MEKGITVWMTGKPNSGKTTMANILTENLIKRGQQVEVFDGEILRRDLWPELGFSREARLKSGKRISYFCHILNRNGINCVVATISPYREIREFARNLIENYIEVYLQASDSELRVRDKDGLIAKAEKGEIENFTGVNDPYEEPDEPDLTLYTDADSPEGCLDLILTTLEEMCFIEPTSEDYSEEEKKQIDERLKSLGYI